MTTLEPPFSFDDIMAPIGAEAFAPPTRVGPSLPPPPEAPPRVGAGVRAEDSPAAADLSAAAALRGVGSRHPIEPTTLFPTKGGKKTGGDAYPLVK